MSDSHKPLGWRPFVYGGTAAIFAESCTFPIDTSKTRLQIQGEMVTGTAKKFSGGTYRGMFHCIYSIGKHEGVRPLYRGLSAAILRQLIYGTIKFGMYNHMKRAIFSSPLEETLAVDVVCAMISGGFSNAIANPADMMKIRLQAYTVTSQKAPSLISLICKTISEEGMLALYKGVNPTALRAAVVCGVELPVYDISKKWLIISGWMGDTKECHFVASFAAGLGGAIFSNPIDVIRVRMETLCHKIMSQYSHLCDSYTIKVDVLFVESPVLEEHSVIVMPLVSLIIA
ncbi:Brain mitochondrial carrier protein short-inserted form [Fasciolopsis buskii]|uniref:Brain mitochondrial carrier protein short-inserted form n=1 Tax=Fasciolopsis buskii TaxID=27845 RepID=A0A8E0S146_9TREM|nr:Brain mitochondrial carrier protein short-inserted form [Fasciolopsis buski]